ncbi:MAG: flagellin [Cyanobacteriota bacterium]
MGLVINNNMPSLVAQRHLTENSRQLNKSLEKLSSGLRINRAADDAAGLSISETLRTQIRGNKQAIANSQDGINILQVAEGGLSTVGENLQRIRELTVQAANDTNATNERTAIAQEVYERFRDIDRIASSLRFNTVTLLDGSATDFTLQIGPNASYTTNALRIGDVLQTATTSAIGLNIVSVTVGVGGYFEDGTNARNFLGTLDTAIQNLQGLRGQIGAYQNRLESTVESLTIAMENITATESQIRDLDVASESGRLVRNQILQQAAVGVLAQSNQTPTLALQLLQ